MPECLSELLISFCDFVPAVFKRLWLLIPGILLAIPDIIEKFFPRVHINIPERAWWICLIAGVVIAMFWAYHDLRTKKSPSVQELKQRERDAKRVQQIAYIKLIVEPIPDLLNQLTTEANQQIETFDIKSIDPNVLKEAMNHVNEYANLAKQLSKFPADSTMQEARHVFRVHKITLLFSNQPIKLLIDKLKSLGVKSGDQLLKIDIGDYLLKLEAMATIGVIEKQHISQKKQNDILYGLSRKKEFYESELGGIMTAINKRIQELLQGD